MLPFPGASRLSRIGQMPIKTSRAIARTGLMSLAGTGISRGLVVAAAQSTQELILDANVSVTGATATVAPDDVSMHAIYLPANIEKLNALTTLGSSNAVCPPIRLEGHFDETELDIRNSRRIGGHVDVSICPSSIRRPRCHIWLSRQNPEWRRQTGRCCHNQVGNYLSGSC